MQVPACPFFLRTRAACMGDMRAGNVIPLRGCGLAQTLNFAVNDVDVQGLRLFG